MSALPAETGEFIFNHVVFPPKLPQQEDDASSAMAGNQELLKLVSDEAVGFAEALNQSNVVSDCQKIVHMLESLQKIEAETDSVEQILSNELEDLSENGILAFRLKRQNAALIFRRHIETTTVECFELSAQSLPVLQTTTSLRRMFPASAIEIQNSTFDDVHFRDSLVCRLQQLHSQSISEMNPFIRKTSQHSKAVYESADPSLVTEMFMTILATLGNWIHVQQIQKRDRDDVLCSGDARPWRRSPLWLLIKITIQTTLIHSLGYDTGTTSYKNFMTHLFIGLLRRLHRVSHDDQHILRAKIARRLFKLKGTVYVFVVESASEALNSSREAHETSWQSAIEYDAQRSTYISTSSIAEDTAMRLDKCTKFVNLIMKGDPQNLCPKVPFAPSHQRLVIFLNNGLPELPMEALRDEEMVYALTNIETWVLGELFGWTASALSDPSTDMFVALRKLALRYKDLASPIYQADAEQSSIMILTIAAIWWALDSLACREISLLKRYLPEIPEGIFNPLILPRREHMELLMVIEAHIATRISSSEYRISMFGDPFKSANHFSVLHYESDDTQKTLRNNILSKARNLRERKRSEWRAKTAEYQRLLTQIERSECIYLNDSDSASRGARYHNRHCEYCRLKKRAEAITIQPYEWPLPEDLPCSKAVVFELKCPPAFGAWRDVTWMIVGDLGVEAQAEKGTPKLHLHDYEGLTKFYKSSESTLILSSVTDPLSKARAKSFGFPVEEEDIFCPNGLKLFFFDGPREVWVRQVRSLTASLSFASYCRAQLPEGPYKPLQRYVDTTAHSQNDVIATQVICPTTISLHEYLAYGSLRADGESTQWSNIIRELYGVALSFNSLEVCKLITHAAWQAGPPGNCLFRRSHRLIASESFCTELLAGLRALIEPTCSNWKNDNILRVSITILLRILSLNFRPLVAEQCLALLSICRQAGRDWMMTLHEELKRSDDECKLLQLRDRLLKSVLLCRMTYDREWNMMEKDLNNTAALQTWTFSSILLRQNLPPNEAALDREVQILKFRDCKLAWRIWSLMTTSIQNSIISAVLDAALAEFCTNSAACSTQWSPCDPPNSRWFENQSNAASEAKTLKLSFNALEGHLLIEGQPLGILPLAYVQSKAYKKIFGNRVVPVIPSDIDDMHFMSAQLINGFRVYFGSLKDYHTVRISKDGVDMEVLPQDLFIEKLPFIYVNDYIHLINRSTKSIEFRKLNDPWRKTSESWHLTFGRLNKALISRGRSHLLGFNSPTFGSVLDVFGQVEEKQYIHATTSPECKLQVDLPRFGLQFWLNSSGQLENRELRLVVDNDQSLGALIGLRSRLILTGLPSTVHGLAKNLDRMVIVPVGRFEISNNYGHVVIEIRSENRTVKYYRYHVDETVGRLRSDGSAESELYQVYLHAITSSLLKDPLTSRPGTFEALHLLRRQLNSVIAPLTDAELQMLQLIRTLTPKRSYCPSSNGKMYHVAWINYLSAMTHHDNFAILVEKIMDKSKRFSFFYPAVAEDEEADPYGDAFLSTRARIRSSILRPQIYRKSLINPSEDTFYVERRAENSATRIRHVYEIASYIADWGERKPHTRTLVQDLFELGVLSGFEKPLSLESSISDLLQLSLGEQWGSLWRLCRSSSKEKDAFHLRFLFGIIAYGSEFENIDCLKTLSAFAMIDRIRDISSIPMHTSYDVSVGAQAHLDMLKTMLKEGSGQFRYTRPNPPAEQKREEKVRYEEELSKASREYKRQWPCEEPQMISTSGYHWMKIEKVHSDISTLFRKWFKNKALKEYLIQVQAILDELRDDEAPTFSWRGAWPGPTVFERIFGRCNLPSLVDLVDLPAPTVIPQVSEFKQSLDARPCQKNHSLRATFNDLQLHGPNGGIPTFRQAYKSRLLHSLGCLERSLPPQDHGISEEDLSYHILKNYETCYESHKECIRCFSNCFSPNPANITYLLLRVADLWPNPSVCDLLSFLSSKSLETLRPDWRSAFVALGISVTAIQRSYRLMSALAARDRNALVMELDNYSSVNLIPYPQWLLIEIEGNFRTRESQARVAKEMISPTCKKNNLLQLSMGEGKTSVVTPLVLASLANGQDLCRLLVLKPLIRQTHTLLAQRICGLLNQPLYFMPFSRETPTDSELGTKIMSLFKECIANHGVLLVQPEHLLSFNLMVRERRVYGPIDVAAPLRAIDKWLIAHSRDVLDESDEILDCRFQLIYTLGHQKQLDEAPHRWNIVQAVLDLVDVHATHLQYERPGEIQVFRKIRAAFPTIEMFSTNIEQCLLSLIVESISQGRVPTISFQRCSMERKSAILEFISKINVVPAHCNEVRYFAIQKTSLMNKLLLLRGLIAHGLLIHAIKDKRWSVDYGLHPAKCMSAVPYRAHKVPAVNAEFAQPEVYILLTCLAYYNQGLSPAQVKQSFEVLTRRHDPTHDFGLWIRHCHGLPQSLRDYRSCNVDDDGLFETKIYPALQYSKALVDFFLAHVVFPQEAKEFSEKLSTSGWDIPLTSGSPHLSTGFSGTSDNSFLLPSSIEQNNLPELELTSAKVLDLVLKPENLRYSCLPVRDESHVALDELLKFITKADPDVRILIDVGAQAIGVNNEEVVKTWFKYIDNVEAGIYFDANDNLVVMTRNYAKELFAVSSFKLRMDMCLVFLDEVHTRGSDLKLPNHTRAAVTLGPRLTKDRLVQACLRLRNLGYGQSLMYLAPPSVDLDIREFRHKGLTDELNGHDVVKWALEQSCRQIELYRPLHVKQGLSFFYRRYVARQNPLHEDVESPTELADSPLVEHETQNLHDLYAPAAMQNEAERHLITLCRRAQDTDIQRLLREYDSLKLSSQSRIAIHEEHEREIEQEVEKQAQISRPGPMTPAVPFVDPQLDEYVREGSENMLLRFSYARELLVARSSAAHELRGSTTIWKHIRASAGFASVIENWDFGNIDSTLRPVNWVLVSNKESNEGDLLLISQYEANHIFDAIVGHDTNVRLFSYEPRVSRVMIARDPQPTVISDDDRCEWTSLVPPNITRELYLFAGQLYIPSYEEYLCFKKDMEGYHADQTRPPMTFYKEWFGIRRRGQDFLPTHMGQIVEGKTLPERAFEEGDGCWNGEEYKQIWDGGDLMDWKTEDGVKDEYDIEDEDSVKDEDDLKDEDEIKSEEGIKAENEEKPDVKAEDKITEEKLVDSKEEAMDWKTDEEGCSLRVVSLDENENVEENSSSFEGFSPAQSVARHEDHVDDDDGSDEDLFMADYAD